MIDIEGYVLKGVSDAVRSEYTSASIYGEYVDVPASFPCVTVIESDNRTYKDTQDDEMREHHATVVYDVNVYSNLKNGKKKQAKAIADIVDLKMQDMHFTRTFRSQLPNVDSTIYRITMRYQAVVGRPYTIGSNTVIPVFRR